MQGMEMRACAAPLTGCYSPLRARAMVEAVGAFAMSIDIVAVSLLEVVDTLGHIRQVIFETRDME